MTALRSGYHTVYQSASQAVKKVSIRNQNMAEKSQFRKNPRTSISVLVKECRSARQRESIRLPLCYYCPTWRVESDGVPSIEPPGEIFEEAGSLVHIEDDRSPGPGHRHQLTSPTKKIYTNTEHNKKIAKSQTIPADGFCGICLLQYCHLATIPRSQIYAADRRCRGTTHNYCLVLWQLDFDTVRENPEQKRISNNNITRNQSIKRAVPHTLPSSSHIVACACAWSLSRLEKWRIVFKVIRPRNFWGAKTFGLPSMSYIFLDLSAPGLPPLPALAPPATVKPFIQENTALQTKLSFQI